MAPGDSVSRGDIIGFVGSTGRSTGDHVHYEVLANGQTLNPLRFLLERSRLMRRRRSALTSAV